METLRLGLWGARADWGGLAAMTFEFARHLQPDRTMIIDLGTGTRERGPNDPGRYQWGDVRVNVGYNDAITPETIRGFCRGLDVVYFAETTYREDFCALARAAGVRTVGHVMPELFRATDAQPDRLWVPTAWQLHRLPPATIVVPVPVPTDTFAPAVVAAGAMLHPTAPAFHDRNGTDLVLAALAYLDDAPRVVFSGPHRPPDRLLSRTGRRLPLDYITGVEDRRDGYPAVCGCLLLPRRYAGLSLPMQEAAGLGWPIITLDRPPQNGWVHPTTLVSATNGPDVRMVAGQFNVADANPRHLASTILDLYADPGVWEEASRASLLYAEQNSWANQLSRYRELLEAVAG